MEKLDPSLKPLQIIETLSYANRDGMGITDLSEKAGLSKSTAYRLVNALTDAGYLLRNDATKKYKLGHRILRISSFLMSNNDVKDVARPYLKELSRRTRETVHLVQLDGLHGIYTDKFDSPQPVGLLSKVGKNIPLHSTSAGKILFAHMHEEIRKRLYEEVGLFSETEHTIVTKKAMEIELAKVRKLGYAFDRMENRDGIYCIAAPIFNQDGEVVAAFSVSGPSFRFSLNDAKAFVDLVKETSLKVSNSLGFISV